MVVLGRAQGLHIDVESKCAQSNCGLTRCHAFGVGPDAGLPRQATLLSKRKTPCLILRGQAQGAVLDQLHLGFVQLGAPRKQFLGRTLTVKIVFLAPLCAAQDLIAGATLTFGVVEET